MANVATRDEHSILVTSGAIFPKMLAMAIPLAATSVMQLLFNAADVAVLGNFGSEFSVAAVGSTAALIHLVVNLFIGVSIGANALVARYFGAGDSNLLSRTVHTSIALAIACGAALMVVGIVFAEWSLRMMGAPEETMALSKLYVQICFCGAIPLMIYNFGCSILRSKGDTRRPLYYLTVSGVINTGLNVIFVTVCDLDVAGVAYATLISWCVSAFLILRCLMNETDDFRVELRKLKIERGIAWDILKIGVPAGVQGIVFSLSNVVIQSSVNGFGPVVMAGSAAAQQVEGIVWTSMNAFAQCALTFVSQNLGARQYRRIDRITLTGFACVLCVGFILGSAARIFAFPILSVFTQDSDSIAIGTRRIFWVCGFYYVCGLMDTIAFSIRGMGYNMTPTIVSLLGACGLRILWIMTVFQVPRWHTFDVLFTSYIVSWTVTFLAHCVCYYYMRRSILRRVSA